MHVQTKPKTKPTLFHEGGHVTVKADKLVALILGWIGI